MTMMVDMWASPNYGYDRGSFKLKKSTHGYSLNDIVSAFIHPRSHTSSVTLSQGHFLSSILNSETIDLAGMIYLTIISHSTTYVISTFYYPYLITYCSTYLFSDISSTKMDKA